MDVNGDTSLLSNVACATTLGAAATDTTAPDAITDLAVAAGTPPTSRATLNWTAKGDDGTTGVAYSYTIKQSTSAIIADNFDSATLLFNDLYPLPNGYSESFTVTKLSANTTYYFAIKIQDKASNISAISNVVSITTANTLPTVTDISPTGSNDNETKTVTITGTNFINNSRTAVSFISASNAIPLTQVTFVSETQLTATVPLGMPAGTYQARVTTDNGTSPLSSVTYTITEIVTKTPLPTVTNLTPKIAASNTAVSGIKILGENLTGATAVNFGNTATTSFTIVSDTKITANAPGLAAGEYDVTVTTANGTNSISLVKFTVSDPIVINATDTRDISTSGVIKLETSEIPIGITFETTGTVTHTIDCEFGGSAETTDTNTEIKVTIPPQTIVTDGDGNPYTGDINPPQVIEPDESVMTDLCGCAVVIDMGNPEETLNLSNDFITQLVLTAPHRPLVWYFNKTSQSYELAGIYGTVEGVSYTPGGIMLYQVGNVYTVGVLLDHMSSFATGVEPTITSFPAEVTAGENITITGTNFDPVGGEVYFDNLQGNVVSKSLTEIVVTVPAPFEGGYVLKVINSDTHYCTALIHSPFTAYAGSTSIEWVNIGEIAGTGATGEIFEPLTATSVDENLTINIPAGTIALDKDGNPLSMLTSAINPIPPPSSEETSIIGQAYDIGPTGATFDPPITLKYVYDPALIPDGVAEEDLFMAYYDGKTGEWPELPFTVDPATNTMTGSVQRLATIAIIAPLASAPAQAPVAFLISNLSIQPTEVTPKDTVTVTVLVSHTGDTEDSYTVALMINGVKETEKSVTVAAGNSRDVSFNVTREDACSYSVAVDDLSSTFVVVVPTPTEILPINWPLLGGIMAGLMVVILLIISVVRRNGRSRRRAY